MQKTYPAWRYHATKPPRLIYGPHQERDGWEESPAAHGLEASVRTEGDPSSLSGMVLKPAAPKDDLAPDETFEDDDTPAPPPPVRANKGESKPPPPPGRGRK